jgi:hypothetical protein
MTAETAIEDAMPTPTREDKIVKIESEKETFPRCGNDLFRHEVLLGTINRQSTTVR